MLLKKLKSLIGVSSLMTAALLIASTTAHAVETVKVRLDFLPYGLHAPFYLAFEKGWFAEKGIAVEIDDGNGSGPALALVSQGKYDIAHISLAALPIAREKGGMPIKAIAAVVRKGDVGLVVDENSKINSPKDLEGKTIIYSTNSVETPFIDIYLKRAGVDRSKVNMMNVDLSAKISTYMAGKGDGMLSPVPLYTLKGITPRASKGILFSESGIQVPSFGLVASEDAIAKRPKEIAAFVSAFQRAWIAIYTGGMIDEGVAALIKNRPNAKLDPKVMKAQIEAVYPFLNTEASKGQPLLWMPPSDWKAAVAVMEELKLIKDGTVPESIYTNQFVPK